MNPEDGVLESLIEWWGEQRGEQPDARTIADWLWLNSRLQGVPLQRQFAIARGINSASELLPQRQSSSSITKPPQADSSKSTDPAVEPEPPKPHLPTFFPEQQPFAAQRVEPTARLLSPSALPEADDVKAALQRQAGVVPLLLSQAPLLPHPYQFLQALRPLLRRQPHPRWRVLDEERSAVRSAELQRPWPIFNTRKVPAVAVRLWLDGGVSMAVWQPLAEELQKILASSQAFAKVELKHLNPVQLSESSDFASAVSNPGDEKLLTLLLSDTAGRHWWDGSIDAWLGALAIHHPLAILHTLPIRYWKRTALRRGEQVTLSNRLALAPNQGYRAVSLKALHPLHADSAEELGKAGGLKIPVLTLDPRDLAPWAAMVQGDSQAHSGGTLLPLNQFSLPLQVPEAGANQPLEPTAQEAERLWLAFRQQASPEAQRLMLVMAAAPLLTLPVMRLLLAAKLPELATPLPLAEVLVSGLLRRLPMQEHEPPERLQFVLLPPLQRLLEAQLAPRDRIEVIQAVTDLLERRWNRQGVGPSFETLLTDPLVPLPKEGAGLAHIANVTAAMLDRLPGKAFHQLAERLRAGVGANQPPLWPEEEFPFQEQLFPTAELLPIPEAESISFSTARYLEQELRRIRFETARITLVARPNDRGNPNERTKRNVPAQKIASQQPAVEIHRNEASTWAFFEPLQRDALPPGATAAAAAPLSLTLVEIPAGSFLMGSPPEEPERSNDEGPQHEVTLESFFISQTPITQAQWREVALWQERPGERWSRQLETDPSRFQSREGQDNNKLRLLEGESKTDHRPVERVSWEDAMEFCHRLSLRSGRSYTLPSEAQWEYACRAGTKTPFCFGDTISPELANYRSNYAYGNADADGPKGIYREQTTPVGMFPANAWGLQDMHGNVYEWCLDEWHKSYEGAPTNGKAWVDDIKGEKSNETGKTRLLRGGSWGDNPRFCRSACRDRNQPVNANVDVGFRVVCLPQGPSLNP
jgi:formylglycine-generating enzyme required for sulfatase activity